MKVCFLAAAVFSVTWLTGGVWAECEYWCQDTEYTVSQDSYNQFCIRNDVADKGYRAGVFLYDDELNNVRSQENQSVLCYVFNKYGCSTPCTIPYFTAAARADGPPGNGTVLYSFNANLATSCVPQS